MTTQTLPPHVERAVAKAKAAVPKAKAATKKAAKATKAVVKAKAAKAVVKAKARKPRSSSARSSATVHHESAPHEPLSGIDQGTAPSSVDEATASAENLAKKGALARLAGGVGSLIARMTRKKEPDAKEPDADQTIEIATDDILSDNAVPPPIPAGKPKRQ